MAEGSKKPEEIPETDTAEGSAPSVTMDLLKDLFQKFSVATTNVDDDTEEQPEQLLPEVSFKGVAEYIASDKCKNIIVMSGAGISTAAGIPDFRSPGSGLYDNLQKYDLPNPQAIFEINFFKKNPQPFYTLAKELYPGNFKPTTSHYFIKLLEQKGLLKRAYTQNIDTLERVAGVSGDKLVEAHGTFHTSHCVDCAKEFSQEWVKDKIFKDEIPRCESCENLVKPDIVFFGEALPKRFFELRFDDFESCDLLIIMGTSLKVHPFASLVGGVKDTTPRLLINREKCGEIDPFMVLMGASGGMDFDSAKAYRDVCWLGNCDDGCLALADLLGWKKELETLVSVEHGKIESDTTTPPQAKG
uniref:NAD-dependent protein deacetylase n=1 Tax=Ciona savignyi TaxID=51511 RepID=H2ZEV4_CIOSA